MIGGLRFRHLRGLPTIGCMTIGARIRLAIDRARVLSRRRMTFGANEFHRRQNFVGMTIGAG